MPLPDINGHKNELEFDLVVFVPYLGFCRDEAS
jgi:hypothetical protein